jgi:hypothetical protein
MINADISIRKISSVHRFLKILTALGNARVNTLKTSAAPEIWALVKTSLVFLVENRSL